MDDMVRTFEQFRELAEEIAESLREQTRVALGEIVRYTPKALAHMQTFTETVIGRWPDLEWEFQMHGAYVSASASGQGKENRPDGYPPAFAIRVRLHFCEKTGELKPQPWQLGVNHSTVDGDSLKECIELTYDRSDDIREAIQAALRR